MESDKSQDPHQGGEDTKNSVSLSNPDLTGKIKKVEKQILDVFLRDDISKRIQGHLDSLIRKELSQMSTLLRESIRAWVQREKEKASGKVSNNPQLLEYQSRNEELMEENKRLKRQLELKSHENKVVLDALNDAFSKKRKK